LYLGTKYYSGIDNNINYVENHFLDDKIGYTVKKVVIDPINGTKDISYIDVAYKANDYYYVNGEKVLYKGQKIGFFHLNNNKPELIFDGASVLSRKECLWDNYDKNAGVTSVERLGRSAPSTTNQETQKIYYSLKIDDTKLNFTNEVLPNTDSIPYIYDDSSSKKYYIEEARMNLRKAYFKRLWEFEPYQYILQE